MRFLGQPQICAIIQGLHAYFCLLTNNLDISLLLHDKNESKIYFCTFKRCWLLLKKKGKARPCKSYGVSDMVRF